MLTIDIHSDVVCPWCYIGKARLEKALRATALKEIAQVRWRPFELNPGLPLEGVDRKAYMAAKFGEGYPQVEERVATIGRFENIPFDFGRIARVPNTLNAHRLIRWAETRGRQNAVVDALFKAFFVEGRDVGSPSVLAQIAAGSGLPAHDAEIFLASQEFAVEIKEDEGSADRAGIRFVPYFILNGRWTIRGAEDPDTMAGVLREAAGPISTQNT